MNEQRKQKVDNQEEKHKSVYYAGSHVKNVCQGREGSNQLCQGT
jgi:hypothetical protein